MGIEIILGLPHLADGPILARAALMQQPSLISANALSVWTRRQGWPEWRGWRLAPLVRAHRLASLDLDSAGFVAMARYRGFPWSIDAYFELARAFPFRRIASLDYCTEQEVAGSREEVLDRIARTVRANRECRLRASDLGLLGRFMPVLQGRTPADYEACAEALWRSMIPGAVIGVGSMCRRPIAGPDGLIAVVAHLDHVLPAGVRLHLFGVKGAALPYLTSFSGRVASIDSQAYGIAARRDAHRRRIPKTDGLVADHMERWLKAQLRRLSEPRRCLPLMSLAEAPPVIRDPWHTAIAQAREDIRSLIACGDLDHDAVTEGWVAIWAAEIAAAAVEGEGEEAGEARQFLARRRRPS